MSNCNCNNCDQGHDCNFDEEFCQEPETIEVIVLDEDNGYCD